MSVPILTRVQLLDYAQIAAIIKETTPKTEISVIDNLKQQCKTNSVSIRDFDKLLKQIKQDAEAVVELDNQYDCLPTCIQNTGDSYVINDSGVHLINGNLIIEVCPHPIFPIEVLTDIDTGYEKVRISFKRKNQWHDDIILDRQDIATNKGIVKLSNYGVLVNDSNAGYLVKYFCDIERLNENTIKTSLATGTLGYSKYGFIPYTKNVIYNLNNQENKRRFELYRSEGSNSEWLKASNEIFNYTIPKILTAAAYSSLLIEKTGINPFGVHLWGETGKGKSVALLCAASVYGYPDIKNGIVYTGNTTANGLEPRLAFNKNCAFFLDELSMLSPQQIDNMIYLIMQGQGKARMDKSGNTKNTYYWNLVSVSNAEMPITNDISKGGIFNRIIQIGVDGWVFGDMDLKEIAETFKTNYGFGAEIFVKLIERPEIIREISELKKNYYNAIISFTEDKQANAGACLLTAFEIARKYIYFTDKTLSVEEVRQYLHTPDEISQVRRAYDKLCDWLSSNYRMFDDTEINQSKWGNITDGCYNILPLRFSEFCNTIAHINERQFLIGLRQYELIKCTRGELKNRIRFEDKTVRVITVKPGIQTRNRIGVEGLEEVKDDDGIPF